MRTHLEDIVRRELIGRVSNCSTRHQPSRHTILGVRTCFPPFYSQTFTLLWFSCKLQLVELKLVLEDVEFRNHECADERKVLPRPLRSARALVGGCTRRGELTVHSAGWRE